MPRKVHVRMSRFRGSLRSLAIVVIQHATKSLAAMDLAFRLADFLAGIDQLVAEPLVIPRAIIMNQVGVHRATK